jgi:hypothetical protein
VPNRPHLGLGFLSCALSAVLFAACGGSGSGGTGGASGQGGASGAAAGRGGGASGGAAGTAGLAGSSGTSGQAGAGGASGGQGGTAGLAGSSGSSGQAGASGGQGGAAGTAGLAGSSGTSGQAGSGASAGQGGASAGASGTGGSPASTFSCSDLGALDSDATSRMCFDFSSTSAGASWTPDGGTWTVVNGQYVATGPSDPVTCVNSGDLMTASLVNNFSAADVRVHVEMTSVDRPDKVIVLRSRDSGDRIELNFIAYWDNNGTQAGGFLSIQELVNCQQSFLAPATPVPHNVGDTLTVDLDLVGTQLTIKVGGVQIFDGALTIPTDPGGVGVGVVTGGTVVFDDFWVEALN